MAYSQITEAKNADSVLLGLGRLGISTTLTSPAVFADVGYLKGIEISYTREFREFTSAGLLVKRLVFSDRLTATAQWAEVSISNLAKLFTGTATADTITFGGSRAITSYQLKFEHQRSDNQWLTFEMFKATPGGEFNLAFDEEEYIQYPVEFVAEVAAGRTAGEQYGRIRLHTA